ncbi:MAG: hypothetical protein JNL44_15830 [Gemmatimonadetes bacterium]|nr:hypothetical protein [Gemmatimonadota bacterium]
MARMRYHPFANAYARRLATLVGAFLVASCETPTEPRLDAGVYVLESIAGYSLPAVTYENVAVRQRLTADTLRLMPDLTGTRVSWVETEPLRADLEVQSPTRLEWPIAVERRDGALRAAEHVFCLASEPLERCESLWNQAVEVRGDRLRVGVRWYRRAAP